MKKLHKISIVEEVDVEVEIRRMKQLYAQSLAMEDPMTNIQFGQVALSALPASWNSFFSSISSQATSASIIGRITQQQERLTEQQ